MLFTGYSFKYINKNIQHFNPTTLHLWYNNEFDIKHWIILNHCVRTFYTFPPVFNVFSGAVSKSETRNLRHNF